MKYIKLVNYDLKNGLLRNPVFLLAPIIVFLLCRQCGREMLFFDVGGTWGVYVMYLFMGMEKVSRQTMTSGYLLPVFWVLLLLVPLFLTLWYPFRDMAEMGPQILLRSGSRSRWWLSKCAWNLACTAVYILLVWGTAALYCLCRGVPLSMEISTDAAEMLFADADVVAADVAVASAGQKVFCVLLLPYLVIASLSMMEMLVGLVFSPMYSLLACVAFLTAGTCAAAPALFVNYANLTRSALFVEGGLDGRTGFAVCFIVLLGSVLAGGVVFRGADILPGKKEVS